MIFTAIIIALLANSTTIPDAPVYGTVRAEGSLEPIPYATVQLPRLERGVLADARGYFVIPDVPTGTWQVRVSAVGYRPVEIVIEVSGGTAVQLEFLLPTQPVEIAGVQVRATRETGITAGVGPGAVRVDPEVVDRVPALAEADVLRTLQTLPSVQAASDFSSALYVRGGSPDQNLLLLDGAPLFNPYHLGGVFGSIDPDAISTVNVLPGAFPARLGDRVSSVIEIRTRDGGRDRVRGNGAIGLVSSRAGLDGPLPGGRGSYLVSARRTYLDLFTDAASALGLIDGTLPYSFSDAHLKLTHDIGALGRLSASFHLDAEELDIPDELDFSGDADFDWGTRSASLNYWQPIGPIVGEFRAAISSFDGSFDVLEQDFRYDSEGNLIETLLVPTLRARTTIRNALAAADFTWYRPGHRVRAGAQIDRYLFDYDIEVEPDEFGSFIPELRRTDQPVTLAAYVEDEWAATPRLDLRAGVRVMSAGARGTAWMPRIGVQYALSPALTLAVGAGRYAQVLHSLRDEESLAASLVAYDLLAAVPPEIGLTVGRDLVVGAEWTSRSTSVRIDAYTKRLDRLPIAPTPDELFEAPILVTEGFLPGRGKAHGFELLGRHRRGGAEFSLAYAFLYATRELDGESYSPRFERRHTLDALAALPLGESGQFSTRLVLGTGQPYTPAVGVAQPRRYDPARNVFAPGDFGGQGIIVLGEHNSDRLPGYLRLDVAARKTFERTWFGRDVSFTPYLQILNVLNTRNVLFAEPSAYGVGGPALNYTPQLPIFPTLGIEWTF